VEVTAIYRTWKSLYALYIVIIFISFHPYCHAQQTIINEVLYNPAGPDTGLEFVELINISGIQAVLTGFELKLADSNYFTFPEFTLQPSARVIVHNNLEGTNTTTDLYTGPLTNMGNTHSSVALFSGEHAAGNIVDFVQYGDTQQQWQSAAVNAGIWPDTGEYVDNVTEGLSINLDPDGEDNNQSSDWSGCDPSPLEPNCIVVTPSATPTSTPTVPTPASPTPTTIPTQPTWTPTITVSATPAPPTDTPSPPPTNTPVPVNDVVVNEVFYDALGSDTGMEWIELLNTGMDPVDLTGYDLKPDGATYFTFDTFILDPGSRVAIHINTEGINTDTELFAGLSGNMSNTSGSIVLFSSSEHSSSTIVDFIQYGAAGQTWEGTAVDAGIWTAGEFAPDVEEGDSLNLDPDGQDNNSAMDWNACYPTMLDINCQAPPTPTEPPPSSPTPTTGPGTPTAPPGTPTEPPTPSATPTTEPPDSDIVINEVFSDPEGSDTGLEFVELYNRGDTPIDLTEYDLKPDDASYFTFPEFELPVNAFVTIHINTTGTNTDTDLYTGPSSNMGNSSGFIALFNSTTHSVNTIVEYMEYGSGGQSWESSAVSAGIWTAGDFAAIPPEGLSLNVCPNGEDTNSSSDWQPDVPSAGLSNPCFPPPDTPTPTYTQGPSPTPTITPTPRPTVEPVIQMAGFGATDYRLDLGGTVTLLAYVTDPEDDIVDVSVLYAGEPVLQLKDDGLSGDFGAGDDIYGYEMTIPPVDGSCAGTSFRILFRIVASDTKGYLSTSWPYFNVSESSNEYGSESTVNPSWELIAADRSYSSPSDGTNIYMAGYMTSRASTNDGGRMTLVAVTAGSPSVQTIELFYNGSGTGVFLKDDGQNGDYLPGDGVFGLDIPINPGEMPSGDYFFQLLPTDTNGNSGDLWPYLTLCD
jgi:Lamin Tail Domain